MCKICRKNRLTIYRFFEKMKMVMFMKKVFCIIFTCIIIISFCSCNKKANTIEYGGILWEYNISGSKVAVKPYYAVVGKNLRKYYSEIGKAVYVPVEIKGKTVTEIDKYAFAHCLDIEKVYIGEGISKIGEAAFLGCKNLKEIVLPKTLKYIQAQALCATSIEKIRIHENFRSFSEKRSEPFFDCINLKEIIVSTGNHIYASENGVLFSNDMKTLICYPSNKSTSSYQIPDTIIKIQSGAFSQTQNLKLLKIPQSVKTINADFYRCSIDSLSVKEKSLEKYKSDERFLGIKISTY